MSANSLPFKQASAAYGLLFALALVAFWPGYLAAPKAEMNAWTHLHAITATLWMFMLIAQPLAIHAGHRELHRRIGRSSLLVMPVLLISLIGLAHASMQDMSGPALGVQAYFFYVRVVLFTTLVLAYVMAMLNRHNMAVHARYMVCTGLSLIDPVVHRLAHRVLREPDFNYQLLTFGLVGAILVSLIVLERHARSGRQVFPIMLGVYALLAIPLVFDFYKWGAVWQVWKSLTAGFAGLPIP